MGRKFGFSWSVKRASGISGMKNRISRKTGIPLTRQGRQRKIGRMTGCFVATVSYGGYDSKEVLFLRHFRDNILKNNLFGRIFINIYYKIGPYIAEIVNSSNLLKSISRKLLNKLIKIIEKKLDLKLNDFNNKIPDK